MSYAVISIITTFYFFIRYTEADKKGLVFLLLFNNYLVFICQSIVGFPSLKEVYRIQRLNLSVWHPNINLQLFADGLHFGELTNLLMFVPIGFLIAILWHYSFSKFRQMLLVFLISLVIEIGQLFTLYRVTDINDLVINTLGGCLGILLFNYYRRKKAVTSPLPKSHVLEPFIFAFLAFTVSFFFS